MTQKIAEDTYPFNDALLLLLMNSMKKISGIKQNSCQLK